MYFLATHYLIKYKCLFYFGTQYDNFETSSICAYCGSVLLDWCKHFDCKFKTVLMASYWLNKEKLSESSYN